MNNRKNEHIDGAVQSRPAGEASLFDDYFVLHNALPEIALEEVDTSAEFLGRKVGAPLMIASITGGTDTASKINANLAAAAQKLRVPLALSSAKILFHDSNAISSFDVRDLCPDVPLLVNLGLADLESSFGIDDCRAIVERLRADALIFHLNPIHEALQPDGTTDFRGAFQRLSDATERLDFPVLVKEIGHGISPALFKKLDALDLYAIDIAGCGGTSWGRIEAFRAKDPQHKKLCSSLSCWGIPTTYILEKLRGIPRKSKLIASGGIRNGIDVFKALCLGADFAALAGALLVPAMEPSIGAEREVQRTITELKFAMFGAGCKTLSDISFDLIVKHPH